MRTRRTKPCDSTSESPRFAPSRCPGSKTALESQLLPLSSNFDVSFERCACFSGAQVHDEVEPHGHRPVVVTCRSWVRRERAGAVGSRGALPKSWPRLCRPESLADHITQSWRARTVRREGGRAAERRLGVVGRNGERAGCLCSGTIRDQQLTDALMSLFLLPSLAGAGARERATIVCVSPSDSPTGHSRTAW